MAPDQQKLSFFQKVILMIYSLPEVAYTFAGMRNQSYVKDVLESVNSKNI